MPRKQITGLGPKKADGSVDLFTIEARPTNVSAEWLAAQSTYPAVGDDIEVDGETVTLVIAAGSTPVIEPQPKKETGSDEPTPTPAPSLTVASGVKPPMSIPDTHSFVALPTQVDAYTIVSVGEYSNDDHCVPLALSNGENVIATKEMLARYMPVVGDYWVVQPDGYIYLNPKDVFERKYAPAK